MKNVLEIDSGLTQLIKDDLNKAQLEVVTGELDGLVISIEKAFADAKIAGIDISNQCFRLMSQYFDIAVCLVRDVAANKSNDPVTAKRLFEQARVYASGSQEWVQRYLQTHGYNVHEKHNPPPLLEDADTYQQPVF